MEKKSESIPYSKKDRASIRLTPEEKEMIKKAARLHKKSFSAFMIESSCSMAAEILADQTNFVLPEDKWQIFCDALDRPPQENPSLKKLLTQPTVFDE